MTPDEYKVLFEVEERHWWFVGMRKIVAALLDPFLLPARRSILDAGCGTGYMLSWLQRYSGGARVVGVEVSPIALSFCLRRGERLLARASLTSLPFPSNTFDLITTFDVLDEFSEDDVVTACAELARVLKAEGMLLVRVPALQRLYSDHDRAIGTAHRYTCGELSQRLARHGLNVERLTFANALLFPAAVIWRWLRRSPRAQPRSDVKPLPRRLCWLNPLLVQLLALESIWLRSLPWRLPVGLSAIAVARKNQSSSPGFSERRSTSGLEI